MLVLECSEIIKQFGSKEFRLNIEELTVNDGESVALLGPNGSGKTTLMKIILDLIRPNSGSIIITGNPNLRPESRRKIAYLPELFSFPDHFSAYECLLYYSLMGNSSKNKIKSKIDDLAQRFNIQFLEKKVKHLSKGMHQLLGWLQILICEPSLLILDEPFSGLDPVQKQRIIQFLEELKQREALSILITTHTLSDLEKLGDTLYLIDKGRLITQENRTNIIKKFGDLDSWYIEYFRNNSVKGYV